MKKLNTKILGISFGISSLIVVLPNILASCSTNHIKEFPSPNQIIDFNKFQKNVYVSKKDDSITDPFAPIHNGQELYQFAYKLTNKLDNNSFEKIKNNLSLEKDVINSNDKFEYYVKRDFRNVNLLKNTFSTLTYNLQSENSNSLTLNGNNEIIFDSVLNENLESIVRTKKNLKQQKTNSESISFTWYVYPKKDKYWNVNMETTKTAYFSINIY